MKSSSITPTLTYENALRKRGFQRIVGVDEAGCGALAGPVVAGAVMLPEDVQFSRVTDSKLLTPAQRDEMYEEVTERSMAWAYGLATSKEIETHGIRPSTYLAMQRAIAKLNDVQALLVDAWTIPDIQLPQQGIVRGDRQVLSIAAASIIAKVTRDRMMVQRHEQYPQYAFDQHKGYGTKVHREALRAHGPCEIHRANFRLDY